MESKMKNSLMVPILILVLLLIGTWVSAPSLMPAEMGESPTPSFLVGTVDSTEGFRGYSAFLDNEIKVFEIWGDSMWPTFDNADSVFWVDYSVEDLELGDIIGFSYVPTVGPHKGKLFRSAHRVVKLDPRPEGFGVRAQGDNRPSPDAIWITDAELNGLVIGVLFTSSQAWGKS
jgi:hypothetical protein